MSWVLVLYIFAGTFAKGDSVTLHSVNGFTNEKACIAAGEKAKPLVNGSAKEYKYVCVKVE